MNRSPLRAAVAAGLVLLSLVAVLVVIAGASMLLGWMEGLTGRSIAALEWVAGALLLALLLAGLYALWRYFYRRLGREAGWQDPIPAWRRRKPSKVGPDGWWDEPSNVYVDGTGQVIHQIHPASACKGRGCSIHGPSDHSMRSFRTHWRGDRAIMERICPHGVGHPDPDQRAFWQELVEAGRMTPDTASAEGVHGCDGCCVPGGQEVLNDPDLSHEERRERFQQLSKDAAAGQTEDA